MKRIISILLIFVFTVLLVSPAKEANAAAIKISKAKATLEVDAMLTLKVTGTKSTPTWTSSKKSVATVSKKGVITAKGEGEATITATVDKKKYTCKITVVDSNKESASSEKSPTLTMGQKNALSKAKSYLELMAFSYSGLVGQLEYEGFTNEEAIYAVDNCGADWNEQAALKAKSYLDFSSFSRSGLIEQLEYEGFTNEQAVYGVTKVGY